MRRPTGPSPAAATATDASEVGHPQRRPATRPSPSSAGGLATLGWVGGCRTAAAGALAGALADTRSTLAAVDPPAAAYTLATVTRTLISPVLDAYTLQFLTATDTGGDAEAAKARYGVHRMWGAVAWAATSLVLGAAIDAVGFGAVYAFRVVTTGAVVPTPTCRSWSSERIGSRTKAGERVELRPTTSDERSVAVDEIEGPIAEGRADASVLRSERLRLTKPVM